MGRYKDLIGQKFGKLTVISLNEEKSKKSNIAYWNCMCECGNTKTVIRTSLTRGLTKSCGKCNIISNYPQFLKDWDYDKNAISPSSITISSTKSVWWKCPNGHSYKREVRLHCKENLPCPYCSEKIVLKGYNDLNTIRPDLTQYLCNEEDGDNVLEHSHKLIKTKCPICGRIKEMSCSTLSKVNTSGKYPCSCFSDSMSFPELFMSNVLAQLNVEFETQKVLNGKKYLYDFYLPLSNTIIETHGIQHYEKNGFSKLSGISLEQQQKIDIDKEFFAKQQNINYIIIDCRNVKCEYMKNSILNSELNNMYDLSKVKWEECGKSIGIVKPISEKWNEGFTVKELMTFFDKDRGTILSYLNIGTFSNLCNYNEHESRRRGQIARNKKRAYCIEDNKIIEDIPKYIKENNFCHTSIYDCCNGKKKTYKGKHYIWLEEK